MTQLDPPQDALRDLVDALDSVGREGWVPAIDAALTTARTHLAAPGEKREPDALKCHMCGYSGWWPESMVCEGCGVQSCGQAIPLYRDSPTAEEK